MMVAGRADESPTIRHESFLRPSKRLKTGPTAGEASFSPKPYKQLKNDKIGERVAVLQQMVAPFGKSDTASVLTEATSYIKFLHDQLQVLVHPYLPSASRRGGDCYRLRSRGLCLIPVDAAVLIAGSNGADIWAPLSKY
ncbi:Transcription factor bHLH113 [Platanthera guangdongensis]|uniref:Transcription factor bHLH113 n=1 Tax=Platanthera guangdongensis TaxID=2320717 RepID=A0ABR2M2L7_9ASPA